MPATADAAPQTMEFKTELKQLLDLIIHSLYTKKEIFLRELISNSADAIDKLRFEGLTAPELLGGETDWKIRLVPDEKAGTLTISDNGVGMSRDAVVENLGTIARSGTRAFLDNLRQADAKDRPELIGQFGVGFYSSFMVADRVTVLSRPAGPDAEGVKWESDGQGQFAVEPFDKPTRGTDVVLHLRDDAKEFLDEWRLREVVKRYSDFIEHPIVAITTAKKEEDDEEKKDEAEKKDELTGAAAAAPETKEQVLNSRQAIWLRPKTEIKAEEYNAFYKQVAGGFGDDEPLRTIHLAPEGGAVDFRAILFIPKKRGFDWMGGPEKKSSLDLYVRRVLIQHESEELVPPYLRFVKGVVDCLDLPLNVSRETIQHDPRLAKVRSNVVNRVLATLDTLKANEYDTYVAFYKEFSQYLKEGAAQDFENRDRLYDLLLFESTKTKPGEYTTLAKYVEGMSVGQEEILFLVGDSRELVEHSPYLETFQERGQEVLLLTEPIDEFLAQSMYNYKGKRLKAADRSDAAGDKKPDAAESFQPLLDALKAKLADEVKDVRLTARLKESAAVLVADAGAMSAHMERLMQRMGRGEEVKPAKRILELNGEHSAVRALLALQTQSPADERIEAYGRLLYDEAVIAEGSRVKDPAAFARRINDLIAKAAGQS